MIFNSLNARAFFWSLFKNIEILTLQNAISQEWINQITKFCIPFCRNVQALERNCVQSYSCPKLPRCHRVYMRHWDLIGLMRVCHFSLAHTESN